MKCTKKLLLTFSKDGSHVDYLTPLTELQFLYLVTFSRIPLFQMFVFFVLKSSSVNRFSMLLGLAMLFFFPGKSKLQ
jgi:hypothetical protein